MALADGVLRNVQRRADGTLAEPVFGVRPPRLPREPRPRFRPVPPDGSVGYTPAEIAARRARNERQGLRRSNPPSLGAQPGGLIV